MAKSWFIDGRTLAEEIKTSGLPSVYQVKNSGTNWECPQCSCRINKFDGSTEWPGLPKGVKFDPSDVELLDHLAAKCGVVNVKSHEYIDVFIPTIDVEQGICYKHPENLPGTRKDGNSFHLFYQSTNAYAKGQRKRRKICSRSSSGKDVRWHKTGKTKAIFKNGIQIGCKKIMVLYGTSLCGSKPCKLNWVMHQYHLGANEDEKENEYVVSKIFYQAEKQIGNTNIQIVDEVMDPRTPMNNPCDPLGPGKTPIYEDISIIQSPTQQDDLGLSACKDDSNVVDLDALHENLFNSGFYINDDPAGATRDINHDNLDTGSPPYFSLAELYFPSEDSFCGWFDFFMKTP